MGIEDEEEYGYQQQNYTTAQQNYTTHQPGYTMAQQNYPMAQQNGYDEDGYYAANDDNTYYAANDRRYVSHAGLNQAMPSTYHHQQHHQMNNYRVVKPAVVYKPQPAGWGWGWGSSTNSRQYFGNRAPRYSDSGYVHQNSGGGYQSEWMYN